MAYATVTDVQDRATRTYTEDEQRVITALLEDAAVVIDSYNANASQDAKQLVSCRMVIRAIGDGGSAGYPVGATQGSISALDYSQSWTINGGSSGELYFGKLEKKLLGVGNQIGAHSCLEGMVSQCD